MGLTTPRAPVGGWGPRPLKSLVMGYEPPYSLRMQRFVYNLCTTTIIIIYATYVRQLLLLFPIALMTYMAFIMVEALTKEC